MTTEIPDNVKALIKAVLDGRTLQVTCPADDGEWSTYTDPAIAVGILSSTVRSNPDQLLFRLAPIVVERYAAGWCINGNIDLHESELSIDACKSMARERDYTEPEFFVRMQFEISEGGETGGLSVRLLSSETMV